MKLKYFTLVVFVICFILSGCQKEELEKAFFPSSESDYELIFRGEKYYMVGGSPYDTKNAQKVAYIEERAKLYIYLIEGYDDDFIHIYGRIEPGVVSGVIYVKEGVEEIPWYFAEQRMPLKRNELIFENRSYYLFSSSPDDFRVREKVADIIIDNKAAEIFEIPKKDTKDWIAILVSGEENYRVYWSQDLYSEINWEYFQMQREYPGIELFEEEQ